VFNVGGGELLIILFVALVVLGPDKLPDAARKIGNVMGEVKRMSAGFQEEVRSAMDTPARIVHETVTQTSAPTSDAPVTDPGAEVAEHQVGSDAAEDGVDRPEPDGAAPEGAALDPTIAEPPVEPPAAELPTTEAPAVLDAPTVEAPTVVAPIANVPIDQEPDADAPRRADDAAAFAGNPRDGLAK